MPSFYNILLLAPTLLAVANSQGVITSAQGTTGSPASLPLQIDLTKADANIIRTSEITDNVVNQCGRTLLFGNIDIGQNTEDQLAAKTVTSVTKGGAVTVNIDSVNSEGTGAYSCDMDLTSNADGASGQTKLAVTQTNGTDGLITLALTMPTDMACTGGPSPHPLSSLYSPLPKPQNQTN